MKLKALNSSTFKNIFLKNVVLTIRRYDYEHLIKLQKFVDVKVENVTIEKGEQQC